MRHSMLLTFFFLVACEKLKLDTYSFLVALAW